MLYEMYEYNGKRDGLFLKYKYVLEIERHYKGIKPYTSQVENRSEWSRTVYLFCTESTEWGLRIFHLFTHMWPAEASYLEKKWLEKYKVISQLFWTCECH